MIITSDLILTMNLPLVSTLVPIYGVEKYIERCAVSLFEQTYPNIEFIFVDDCSKDRSIEILNQTIKRYPHIEKKVKIIRHNQNGGLKASRNTAVENATGDFVIHVDSDDYVEKDAIEKLVNLQQSCDYDIVSSEYNMHVCKNVSRRVIADYESPKEMLISILKKENEPTTWGRLIRRSLYIENSLKWDEKSLMSEDWQMTPRLFYYAQKTAIIHTPLFNYNKENETSATAIFNPTKMAADAECKVLFQFFGDKEPIFKDALNYGRTKMVLSGLVALSTRSNCDEIYERYLEMLETCNDTTIKQQGRKYKAVAILAKKKNLLAIYVQIGLFANRIKRDILKV